MVKTKSDLVKNIKLDEAINNWKKALADYQNLEKRVEAEREERARSANKGVILRLLPVLDTLMIAAKHVQDEGLPLSVKQFLDVLKQEGVEKIEVQGRNFDPALMECLETEEGEGNKVLEEIRTGFTLNGQVLRPAQVKVGKSQKQEKEEELAKEQLQKGDYM